MPRSSSPLEPLSITTNPSQDPSVKRSRFTCRHLQLLRTASTSTPLRVIAHIDLDAFYAQCEMVRLGTPRETPLAVQQWDSLIAINYAARSFGVTRMISAAQAKQLCPEIVLQHVATFREGEGGKWAYRDDAASRNTISTDKVSLDPYRAQSRRILNVMKDELARWRETLADVEAELQLPIQPAGLEKASIDEVFIDLSSLVFGLLLQRYPELVRAAASCAESRGAPLPPPPTTALEWNGENCLVDLNDNETEADDPDWDDIAILLGSEIVRAVRRAVWTHLNYTCSGGIARNKMIAKLGSACNKPNKQTVVRNRAVQNFLGAYKFTKIRMLGGKLGDQVAASFGTEQVSDLLKVSMEQFKAKFDDDTATWLYGIIRGEDSSEVNPRTQIKSMLSAKSFRPSINSADQAEKWLRIFAADIYNRLVEDGVLEHRRRPKTITLHHRQGAQVRSRQLPIPLAKTIDELLLYELAKTLLRQVMADGRAWPCANLSLSVGSFEDGVSKNHAIDSFFSRGKQPKIDTYAEEQRDDGNAENGTKRRKVDPPGITRLSSGGAGTYAADLLEGIEPEMEQTALSLEPDSHHLGSAQNIPSDQILQDAIADSFSCTRCGRPVLERERSEHDDWHFAKDLISQERQMDAQTQRGSHSMHASDTVSQGRGSGRGRGGRIKPEKGQKRLFFG